MMVCGSMAWALVGLLMMLTAASPLASAQCIATRRLQFKQLDSPGRRSYMRNEGQPVATALLVPMPLSIVELRYRDDASGEWVLDSGFNGVLVSVTITPYQSDVFLSGALATLNQGQAEFPQLTFLSLPTNASQTFRLQFAVATAELTQAIYSGPITFVTSQTADFDFSELVFADHGYFWYPGQIRFISPSIALPIFYLVVLNPFGKPVAAQGLSSVSGTITSSVGSVAPTRFQFAESELAVKEFVYTPGPDPAARPIFTFSATSGGKTSNVSTGANYVATLFRRNEFMAFTSNSYFTEDNVGGSAVLNVALPQIRIQLFTSKWGEDTSSSGLLIHATSEQAMISGDAAMTINGVATFADLRFIGYNARFAVITFTAGGTDIPVSGFKLFSGDVRVGTTAEKGKLLTFASTSFVQSTVGRNVKIEGDEFSIPSIIVQMRDSAYQIDSTDNDVSLQLLVPDTDITAKDPNSEENRIVNGIAAWSKVLYRGKETQFKLLVTDPTGVRAPLSSATISVMRDPLVTDADRRAEFQRCKVASDCGFTMKFSDPSRSSIFAEGQSLFAAVHTPLREVRIELQDVFQDSRAMTGDYVPQLLAYTGNDPRTESLLHTSQESNVGIWRETEWVFSCLEFQDMPQGLVQIKFKAVDPATKEPINGIRELHTGFVTVTQTVVQNFGLTFADENSLFTYVGQASSAVLNVVLPPITIVLIDSAYMPSTTSGIMIVATTSSGTLDYIGSQAVTSNGKAVFASIKFTSIADEAILSFRAVQTTEPVASQEPLSTGPLTLTTVPIPSFELAFSPVRSVNNNVTGEHQTFVYSTLEEARSPSSRLRASIVVRDSAHQYETVSQHTISLEATSNEGSLLGVAGQVIDPESTCPCANFSNGILSYRRGFEGADIYIKYRVAESTNPHLIGKALVVGPIRIADRSIAPDSCALQLRAPLVTLEFKMTVKSFNQQKSKIVDSIAFMAGVEVSRVTLSNVRETTGQDPVTAASWTGAKVDVAFADPMETSTNRKTGALLASELVSLRSTCGTQIDNLANAYYKLVELKCTVEQFRRGINATESCTSENFVPPCECYAVHLMRDNGLPCFKIEELKSEFVQLCSSTLVECRDAAILDVCNVVLQQQKVSYIWLYASLGSIGGVALLALFAWRRYVVWLSQQPTAHLSIDQQYRK